MTKKQITIMVVFVFLFSSLILAGEKIEKEKKAMIQVIESAYMNGICNLGDVAAIKAGFHPEFNLMGISNGKFWKLPIADWAKKVAKGKADGKYPVRDEVTFKYPLIDITGHAAIVKVKFLKSGKHIYTDYLQLYKFADGWRIMNKIYYAHKPPPPKK